jgi:hypothetical protein
MNIELAGSIDLTDAEGSLLTRPTVPLSVDEARALRAAARLLRSKRYRAGVPLPASHVQRRNGVTCQCGVPQAREVTPGKRLCVACWGWVKTT